MPARSREIQGPTNEAGLVTVFEHRDWYAWCPRHDSEVPPDFRVCGMCCVEDIKRRQRLESVRRVREQRRALLDAFWEADAETLRAIRELLGAA